MQLLSRELEKQTKKADFSMGLQHSFIILRNRKDKVYLQSKSKCIRVFWSCTGASWGPPPEFRAQQAPPSGHRALPVQPAPHKAEKPLIPRSPTTSRSSATNILLTNSSYQLDLIISYRESSLNSLQTADRNHLFIFLSGHRNAVQLWCCVVSLSIKLHILTASHLSQQSFF